MMSHHRQRICELVLERELERLAAVQLEVDIRRARQIVAFNATYPVEYRQRLANLRQSYTSGSLVVCAKLRKYPSSPAQPPTFARGYAVELGDTTAIVMVRDREGRKFWARVISLDPADLPGPFQLHRIISTYADPRECPLPNVAPPSRVVIHTPRPALSLP